MVDEETRHLYYTEMWKNIGYRMNVIANGKETVNGYPIEPLTESIRSPLWAADRKSELYP
jgi:hypothetical protein